MLQRFEGPQGDASLVEVLSRQSVVAGDAVLAQELASAVHLVEVGLNEVLIEQGAVDTSVYFILAGEVSVAVNGRVVGTRAAGTQVGEGAAIDAAATRNATIIANEATVLAQIEGEDFRTLADRHPRMWQRLAVETSRRLRQRNVFHRPPNVIPQLFIGCSTEQLALGKALRSAVASDDLHVKVWTDGVFQAGDTTIESLIAQLDEADFAVLILGAEDATVIRGKEVSVTRDNVIFELGLFMGALGRNRALMLCPRDVDLHIPTDLLGLTPLSYVPDEEPMSAVAGAVEEIVTLVQRMGSR